jgi:hypothetical protein
MPQGRDAAGARARTKGNKTRSTSKEKRRVTPPTKPHVARRTISRTGSRTPVPNSSGQLPPPKPVKTHKTAGKRRVAVLPSRRGVAPRPRPTSAAPARPTSARVCSPSARPAEGARARSSVHSQLQRATGGPSKQDIFHVGDGPGGQRRSNDDDKEQLATKVGQANAPPLQRQGEQRQQQRQQQQQKTGGTIAEGEDENEEGYDDFESESPVASPVRKASLSPTGLSASTVSGPTEAEAAEAWRRELQARRREDEAAQRTRQQRNDAALESRQAYVPRSASRALGAGRGGDTDSTEKRRPIRPGEPFVKGGDYRGSSSGSDHEITDGDFESDSSADSSGSSTSSRSSSTSSDSSSSHSSSDDDDFESSRD